MKTSLWLSAVITIAITASAAQSQSDRIAVGLFSMMAAGAAIPEVWKPARASGARHATRYNLVKDDGTTVIRADAQASASALSRSMQIDPAEYPLLRWRWKISNVLKTSDIRIREGDDFPARLYVMFDYPLEKLPLGERMKIRLARALHDPDLPAATLCYVWDSKAPAGTVVPSSYTDRVRLVVVESGDSRVNRWLEVERDVAADFRTAFGEAPPAVKAVAIAADTDNTGESATAFFGDIFFQKQMVKR